MSTPDGDDPTSPNLYSFGLLLGAVSVVAWFLFADNAESGINRAAAACLGIAVIATVFAGVCSVLVGVKAAEARIAEHLRRSTNG